MSGGFPVLASVAASGKRPIALKLSGCRGLGLGPPQGTGAGVFCECESLLLCLCLCLTVSGSNCVCVHSPLHILAIHEGVNKNFT